MYATDLSRSKILKQKSVWDQSIVLLINKYIQYYHITLIIFAKAVKWVGPACLSPQNKRAK